MEKTKSTHVIVSALVRSVTPAEAGCKTRRPWTMDVTRVSLLGSLSRRYLDYTTTKIGCQWKSENFPGRRTTYRNSPGKNGLIPRPAGVPHTSRATHSASSSAANLGWPINRQFRHLWLHWLTKYVFCLAGRQNPSILYNWQDLFFHNK